MAVTLTEKAAGEVKRLISEQKLPAEAVLRVGVVGGGCSGFEYRMNFDTAVSEEEDLVSECHGVRVAVDRKSASRLTGTEIDYHEDLMNRGFVFNNPLAVRTCGCGTSFQV